MARSSLRLWPGLFEASPHLMWVAGGVLGVSAAAVLSFTGREPGHAAIDDQQVTSGPIAPTVKP